MRVRWELNDNVRYLIHKHSNSNSQYFGEAGDCGEVGEDLGDAGE